MVKLKNFVIRFRKDLTFLSVDCFLRIVNKSEKNQIFTNQILSSIRFHREMVI